ncbi:MAG: hypothetical protein ABIH76_08035 [Candidatus Bathyarchaeota archaeon]
MKMLEIHETDVLSIALQLYNEHRPFKLYIDLSTITSSKSMADARQALKSSKLHDRMDSINKILQLINFTGSNPAIEVYINQFSSKTITDSLRQGDVIVTAGKQAFETRNCIAQLLNIKRQEGNDLIFVSQQTFKKRISEVMSAIYSSDIPCVLVIKQ